MVKREDDFKACKVDCTLFAYFTHVKNVLNRMETVSCKIMENEIQKVNMGRTT